MLPNTFTIFLGNEKTIYLKAINLDFSDPLDLTNCTEIDISFPNADGSTIHLFLGNDEIEITQPPVLGKFSALISSEDSLKFNVGEFQNLKVTFTILGEIFTVSFQAALSVFNVA